MQAILDLSRYAAAVARTRAVLGDHAFDAAWMEGQQMLLDQAIADALEGVRAAR